MLIKELLENANFKELVATPSIENFLVDGILGSASSAVLGRYGVSRNFSESEFWSGGQEVLKARQAIYLATELELEYNFPNDRDPLIDSDLLKFASEARIQKLSAEAFDALVKPVR